MGEVSLKKLVVTNFDPDRRKKLKALAKSQGLTESGLVKQQLYKLLDKVDIPPAG